MTNYLFLRGNRNKYFFVDVARVLNEQGHHCHQIKFELADLLYKTNITTVFAPFKVSKKEYPISDEELLSLNIYNITYTKKVLQSKVSSKELRTYKRYMYFIDEYINAHNIEVLCIFNGYHWTDQVAYVIAKKRGLKTFFFEDGLFRPYTITCDAKGINANGSVPNDPFFYDALEIDKNRLDNYLFKPENEKLKKMILKESLLSVATTKAINMLGTLLKVTPKLYSHITWWQAIKYFIFKTTFKYKKQDNFELPKEYVFLPFQVARDTQIFYNSPHIKQMSTLLDLVYNSINKYNKESGRNIKVIVKEHPEDISRNNYKQLKEKYKNNKNVVFLRKFNVQELINNALLITTINSTVGIEAIAKHKKVITLGDALYNIDGVATHCSDPDEFENVVKRVLKSNVNVNRIDKFLYYLRFSYQIEGSIKARNYVTSENVAKRISN
ncbi:capsular polysaccharide export protein, LipB/KpsS family [Paraliobacillus ryukyuensis]|uniref:capsular polysaccharide export protein, LipB/KpsS family n=1 Tax=Paraliobacillus ryukyuensis TaxID=200904 RepID=UPI0009A58069|nr:hypothetical protein [Paraliobacillus ryukyuensis]